MKEKIERNTLICAIDNFTTAELLSRELGFAMKRIRMFSPEVKESDVRITTESRDGEVFLYAEWTSDENSHEEKIRTEEENIVRDISEALQARKTQVMFDCNGSLEKCGLVARVVTKLYHSEPGRIISASPVFDTHGEFQTGVRVTIRYIDENV